MTQADSLHQRIDFSLDMSEESKMGVPKSGKKQEDRALSWTNVGFHGDKELMKLVDFIISVSKIESFIETGTEAGNTLAYVARTYPSMTCYSCDADKRATDVAKANLSNHPNVKIYNKKAVPFLKGLKGPDPKKPGLFWLDAHSHGYGCTLPEEIGLILSKFEMGYILIDDFKVPGADFGFDKYWMPSDKGEEQVEVHLDYNFIQPAIAASGRASEVTGQYPDYKPVYQNRGWILLRFGDIPKIETIPDSLREPKDMPLEDKNGQKG